jgi:hypothetical protein
MSLFQSILVMLASASSISSGQMSAPEAISRRVAIATVLHLDSLRAGRVEAILQQAYERQRAVRAVMGPVNDPVTREVLTGAMRAVCEDADRQLAEVLGPDVIENIGVGDGQRSI